ncbi:NYN domain-containing protein, partial [Streptosporangium sandarakinum]
MDRCALFVDAGYLLADGAMAAHGTRHREAVTWDYPGLLKLLNTLCRERTGLPVLRCYWYEATVEGRRTPEHDTLADIPGLKLRLSRIRPGRREGVDAQVHRDLMTLARNNAVCDAVVVSGDEDLAQVVCDAQDLGVRVTVVHIGADGSWAVSRSLRQECDDLIEIGAGHLRPYVTLNGAAADSPARGNGHHAAGNGQVTVPLTSGSPSGGTGGLGAGLSGGAGGRNG